MELRSCYFCGSTGRTLEPRELALARPDADRLDAGAPDPTSVVLCPDCDAKLDRVLDHVLGPTRDRTGAAVAPPATGATATDQAPADADPSTEITFGDVGRDAAGDGPDDAEPGGEDESTPDDGEDGTAAERTGPAPTAGVDVVGESTPADGADEPASEADEPAAEGTGDANGDDAEIVDGDGERAGDEGAEEEDGTDATDAGGGSRGELRSLGEGSAGTYRKALRLLQNREFPMDRADLVDVLSSAYDLDYGECERLVDLAVERGWLVEDDGELHRG